MKEKNALNMIGSMMMVYGALVLLISVRNGTVSDMIAQMNQSASGSSLLYNIYMIMNLITAAVYLITGFLSYGSSEPARISRCRILSMVIILLVILNTILYAVSQHTFYFSDFLSLLINIALPVGYLWFSRIAGKTESSSI